MDTEGFPSRHPEHCLFVVLLVTIFGFRAHLASQPAGVATFAIAAGSTFTVWEPTSRAKQLDLQGAKCSEMACSSFAAIPFVSPWSGPGSMRTSFGV